MFSLKILILYSNFLSIKLAQARLFDLDNDQASESLNGDYNNNNNVDDKSMKIKIEQFLDPNFEKLVGESDNNNGQNIFLENKFYEVSIENFESYYNRDNSSHFALESCYFEPYDSFGQEAYRVIFFRFGSQGIIWDSFFYILVLIFYFYQRNILNTKKIK